MSGDCLCLNLGIDCWCTRPGPGGSGYRPHGTPAAARRHYRRGEPLCGPCRQAERDAGKAARLARREAPRRAEREAQAARRAVLAEALRGFDGYRRAA